MKRKQDRLTPSKAVMASGWYLRRGAQISATALRRDPKVATSRLMKVQHPNPEDRLLLRGMRHLLIKLGTKPLRAFALRIGDQ